MLVGLVACGSDPVAVDPPRVFGGDRPVTLQVPEPLVAGREYPLVLILHGYGASGLVQEAYFGLADLATRGDAFVLAPDGLVDSNSRQFWNADQVCCDFDNKNPDDAGYLGGVVDDVMAAWPIDAREVRIVGHSNGGFMAYRMACERADIFTSVTSLAGDAVQVPCQPAEPVNVLHVHGTADGTVPFSGAQPSLDQWTTHNGCTTTRTPAGGAFDLDSAVAGTETQASSSGGCPASGAVDLWTMTGSGHIPTLNATFDAALVQWFADHRRMSN